MCCIIFKIFTWISCLVYGCFMFRQLFTNIVAKQNNLGITLYSYFLTWKFYESFFILVFHTLSLSMFPIGFSRNLLFYLPYLNHIILVGPQMDFMSVVPATHSRFKVVPLQILRYPNFYSACIIVSAMLFIPHGMICLRKTVWTGSTSFPWPPYKSSFFVVLIETSFWFVLNAVWKICSSIILYFAVPYFVPLDVSYLFFPKPPFGSLPYLNHIILVGPQMDFMSVVPATHSRFKLVPLINWRVP